MGLKETLIELNNEIKSINSSDFTLSVRDANLLPSVGDSDLTFENFDDKSKKVKLIETCVLYIDIRRSTSLNFEHDRITLAKLYSGFIRGAIKCATFYNGEVRNIVGDRIMVLFNPVDCIKNAVNTAILLNTFSAFILNKHFKKNEIRCGIGIDHGKMLATKTGTIKRGVENSEYKSLVWLGTPANVASKLADMANKTSSRTVLSVGRYYPVINDWKWNDMEMSDFFDNLELTYSFPTIARFKSPYENILSFWKKYAFESYRPILMTDQVFFKYRKENPDERGVKENWWKPRKVKILNRSISVFEGDIYYTCGKELNV